MRKYSPKSPVHNRWFSSLIVLALFVQEKVQKAWSPVIEKIFGLEKNLGILLIVKKPRRKAKIQIPQTTHAQKK